jgi:predicted ATP-grasp superfamily ATP-dependent carboligase
MQQYGQFQIVRQKVTEIHSKENMPLVYKTVGHEKTAQNIIKQIQEYLVLGRRNQRVLGI